MERIHQLNVHLVEITSRRLVDDCTHGEVVAKLMNHALRVRGRNGKGLLNVARKWMTRMRMKSIAIPTVTVATNMPTFEKVVAKSSTPITAPAIMKQTPTGVNLAKSK